MAVRPIDGEELLSIERLLDGDAVRQSKTASWLLNQVLHDIQAMPTLALPTITGDTSDGYHTFNELYHHRAALFSVICNARPDIAWKSKRHHDGTMYDGMFIVGIETPEGQATYHYDIEPYWSMFHVKELEYAPKWDGHTPDEAIRRIGTLTPPNEWISVEDGLPTLPDYDYCSVMVNTAYKGRPKSRPMIYERAIVRGKRVERWKYYWDRIAEEPPDYWLPLPEPPKEELLCKN